MKAPTPLWALAAAGGLFLSLVPQATYSQALTCIAPENAVGSIDWPAACPFGTLSGKGRTKIFTSHFDTDLQELVTGLPPGEPVVRELVIPPGGIINRNPGGILGGEIVTWTHVLTIRMVHPQSGAVIDRDLPVTAEVHIGPSSAPGGDVQSFDTEMVSLSAVLFGDPDFAELRVTQHGAGSGGSHGGRGATSLRRTATGDFNVDSFIDVTYRIEFTGAGADWGGVSISRSLAVRMQQTLRVLTGFSYEPVGEAVVTQDENGLTVDNIGSSGMDGVSFRVGGEQEQGFGNDLDAINIHFNPLATAVADGQSIALAAYPPPQRADLPGTPPIFSITGRGTVATGRIDWGDIDATASLVTVWDGDTLLAAEQVPDGADCFTSPPLSIAQLGVGEISASARSVVPQTAGTYVFELTVSTGTEVTLPGAAGPVSGSTVRIFAVEAKNPPGTVSEVRLTGHHENGWNVLRVDGWTGRLPAPVSGLGGAVFAPSNGNLVVSNLGSSGEDGVSVSLGGAESLPLRVDLSPHSSYGTGGGGGRIALVARGANQTDLGTAEISDLGNGVAAEVSVNFDGNGASTCRVQVLLDGELRSEIDLPVSGSTVLANLSPDANGTPLLTGCGKLFNGPPWQFPCFFYEFDRPFEFAVGGTQPILGDEIRLLAPDATPGVLDDLRSFEIRGRDIGDLIICGGTTGPFLPAPRISEDQFGGFEFPGGYEVRASRPAYLTPPQPDPAPGAIKTRPILKTFFETARNGNRITFDAVLSLEMTGVGDRAGYSRTIDLPGTIEVEVPPGVGDGANISQRAVWVRNWQFGLVGPDPDFDSLIVRAGTDNGFASSGTVTLTRLDGGQFRVDSFFDIAYEIEFSGAPGGLFMNGVSPNRVIWNFVGDSTTVFGLPHHATGGAELSENAAGGLTISNIGSSGNDGVSIDLPNVEGFTMEFDAANPLTLAPGGVLNFSERGLSPGAIAGIVIGSVACTNQFGAFYNVAYDYSSISPGSTTVQVFNKGALVGEYQLTTPDGSLFFADDDGTGLPPIKGCGKLPGLGSESPCNFIRFCGPKTIRMFGEPDLTGDEVRLLANGVRFEGITNFDLRLSDTVGDPDIVDESIVVCGREVSGRTKVQFYWDRESSSDENSSCWIRVSQPIAQTGGGGGGGRVVIRDRDVSRGLATGKRTPMGVTSPDLQMASFGASLSLSATGTVGGNPGTPLGAIHLENVGDEVALTPNFGGRGGGIIRVRVYEGNPLHQNGGTAAENPLYKGSLANESTAASGSTAVYLKYELEEAIISSYSVAPSQGGAPGSFVIVLGPGVDVELADRSLTVQNATRIEISLTDADAPADEVESIALDLNGLKPFTIDSIFTGPVFAGGLPAVSVGSAQIDQNAAGNLVISNLGSEGLDGVNINIGTADGLVIEPDDDMQIDEFGRVKVQFHWDRTRRGGSGGSFQTEIVSMSLSGSTGPGGIAAVDVDSTVFRQDFGPVQQQRRVSGFDGSGNPTGSVVLPTGLLGQLYNPSSNVAVETVVAKMQRITLASTGPPEGPGIEITLSEPATFEPGDGTAPFDVTRLRVSVHCPTGQIMCPDGTCRDSLQDCVPRDTSFVLQTTGDPLVIEELSLLGFGHRIVSPGGNRVWPEPGLWRVQKEQGTDFPPLGFATTNQTGRLGIGPINMKPIRLELGGAQAPAGTQPGAIRLQQQAINGNSCGTAEIEFVEVAGEDPGVALNADFTAMGTQYANLEVRLDGQTIGQSRVRNGELARIRRASIAQPSLISVGGEADTDVPGAIRAAGYCFTFDRPVAVIANGTGPESALIGNEVCVRPQGSTVPIPALREFQIASNLDEYGVTGIAQKGFEEFLFEHFTVAEIEELIATGFDIDHDHDGANAIVEHATGGIPKISDFGLSRRPGSSIGTGGDGLPHLRHSVVLSPVTDVSVLMRSAEDLQNWNEDQSQFTLVGRTTMPNGNVRLTWELNEPVGGNNGDKVQVQMGPIYVLQPATP